MLYPYTVKYYEANEHGFWIAESLTLKGCVGQGDTDSQAIKELETNETEWLQTARELDIPIPERAPTALPKYSGKFTVRLSPATHADAAAFAKSQGISLTQYVSDAIVAQNTKLATLQTTDKYIDKSIDKSIDKYIDKYIDAFSTRMQLFANAFFSRSYNQSTASPYKRERNPAMKQAYIFSH